MNIIFLGAPGAGKGTQAEIVSERFGIPAISTGAIIREAIKTGTEMGLEARKFTERGALVPDEVAEFAPHAVPPITPSPFLPRTGRPAISAVPSLPFGRTTNPRL